MSSDRMDFDDELEITLSYPEFQMPGHELKITETPGCTAYVVRPAGGSREENLFRCFTSYSSGDGVTRVDFYVDAPSADDTERLSMRGRMLAALDGQILGLSVHRYDVGNNKFFPDDEGGYLVSPNGDFIIDPKSSGEEVIVRIETGANSAPKALGRAMQILEAFDRYFDASGRMVGAMRRVLSDRPEFFQPKPDPHAASKPLEP